jgi:hypothetical protein
MRLQAFSEDLRLSRAIEKETLGSIFETTAEAGARSALEAKEKELRRAWNRARVELGKPVCEHSEAGLLTEEDSV